MEEWKDIKGYEGKYQISNKGRVKSLNYKRTGKEKILKLSSDINGYKKITLCKNSKQKTYLIHKLVAEAFLPNPDNLPVVNHKDENKLNNNVENLEWCTQAYNVNYSHNNCKSRKIICVETNEIFDSSQSVIDKMFDGKGYPSNIGNNLHGRTKSCYGYHFKYIDE